jgi:hypothetical protein
MKIGSGKFESIQLSLMKRNTEINDESKAEYIKYISATFVMPQEYLDESPAEVNPKYGKDYITALLNAILADLISKSPEADADSLGMWIKTSEHKLENAIALQTLQDIREYGKDDVDPLYEFFRMTLTAE